MEKQSGGFIEQRLTGVEEEFRFSGLLHQRLESILSAVGERPSFADDESDRRTVEDIPVRNGWIMDVMDHGGAFGSYALPNKYGESLVRPIDMRFWPTEQNNISDNQYYFDGPKLVLVVGPNGVFDEMDERWLDASEIATLWNDVQSIMPEK
jgi:hypothetical protein